MTGQPFTVVTGQPTSILVQCNLRGSGNVAAQYNSTDLLTAAIIQSRQTTPIVTPTIAWYTALNSQSGYGQAQVVSSYNATQAALLVPTVSYTLEVWRALANAPSNPELIARVPLVVEPLAV